MLLSSNLAAELLVVFTLSLAFVMYLYYRYCFTYWKKKGVAQRHPTFPVGDLSSAAWGKESIHVRMQKLYQEFKDDGHNFGGVYFLNGPVLFLVDPEMVKKILVTDFNYFVDRGTYINEEKMPLTAHLFSMKGDQWRTIRAKFTPVFTSGRMKSMYQIIVKNSDHLLKILQPLAERGEELDIKDMLMRFTTDIIGSTSFGVDVNSLDYPDTEFSKMVAMIFSSGNWKLFKLLFQEGLQNPGNIAKIVHDNREVERYFPELVRDTVEYRDKNNIVRDDFLNTLMQMRSTGTTLQEIVTQCFLFFTAGFETTSSTMSNCVHELAHNQEVQDRLRKEIHEKLGRDSSKYTYEDVLGLTYLDWTIKEILRKYPPVALLNRMCVKPYQIPGTDVVIEKGTPVVISTLGLQRDPDYFPDPLKFDPERFSDDNRIVPYTFIPFGEGPRNCIGLRFGYMQAKVGLATMLNDFKFLPSDKSPRHLAVNPSTTTLVFAVLGGVHAKITKV